MALTGHEEMFCFDKTFVSIIIISFFLFMILLLSYFQGFV